MKKVILSFILLFTFACTSIEKNHWQNKEAIKEERIKLEVGDIIINKKSWWRPTRFFGHSAIVMENGYLAEAYIIFGDVRKIKVEDWLKKGANKKFVVLRLKGIDDEFKKKLMEKIDEEIGKPYVLLTSKMGTRGYYCSQLVWQMYFEVAEELGLDLDLDIDRGFFVFPYDLYNINLLEVLY